MELRHVRVRQVPYLQYVYVFARQSHFVDERMDKTRNELCPYVGTNYLVIDTLHPSQIELSEFYN